MRYLFFVLLCFTVSVKAQVTIRDLTDQKHHDVFPVIEIGIDERVTKGINSDLQKDFLEIDAVQKVKKNGFEKLDLIEGWEIPGSAIYLTKLNAISVGYFHLQYPHHPTAHIPRSLPLSIPMM